MKEIKLKAIFVVRALYFLHLFLKEKKKKQKLYSVIPLPKITVKYSCSAEIFKRF